MELDFSQNVTVGNTIVYPDWAIVAQPTPPPINEQVYITGDSGNTTQIQGSVQEPPVSGF